MSISSASLRVSIPLMGSQLETPKKPGFARRFLIALLDSVEEHTVKSTDDQSNDDVHWTDSTGQRRYGPIGDHANSLHLR